MEGLDARNMELDKMTHLKSEFEFRRKKDMRDVYRLCKENLEDGFGMECCYREFSDI